MGKSDYEYLDEERRKLWYKVNALETSLNERINDELSKIPEDYINESKQASKKASEYRNKSEESKNTIFKFLNQSQEKLENINTVSELVEGLNGTIKAAANEAIENNNSIISLLANVEASKAKIEGDIERLEDVFEDFENLTEKVSKLSDILTESDDTSSKIETLYKSLLARKKEFDQIYYDVFGYTDTDSNTQVKGLKDKLETIYSELERKISLKSEEIENIRDKSKIDYDFALGVSKELSKNQIEGWEIKYSALELKIKALLPNALTAGLSSAYSEKKLVEIEEYKKLDLAFVRAIWGLVAVSLIPFGVSFYSLSHNKTFEAVILDLPRLILSILPLYIPILWVAYSSNKKMNLSKRLSEEYSHKEVLSKTFEGLSTQIDNITDERTSGDLRNKLLYNILEVSAENPGKLISDYNKSDHPLMDALDKSVQLAIAFERLERIPGLSKLASKMKKKSKAILIEEDKMANRGLDDVGEIEVDS